MSKFVNDNGGAHKDKDMIFQKTVLAISIYS